MPVAASSHLLDKHRMPAIERSPFTLPSLHLWMITVSFFVVDQDAPDGMQLTVLTKQMQTAELSRRNIPDAHVAATLGRL